MRIEYLDSCVVSDDTIGGRISLARDACGLSIEATARILGIGATTWSAWENDRAEPFANRLQAIADTLGVSLAWLLSGRGSGPKWSAAECNRLDSV